MSRNKANIVLKTSCFLLLVLAALLATSRLLPASANSLPVAEGQAAIALAPDQPPPIALIKSIIVDGATKTQASNAEIAVKAAGNTTEAAQSGLLLFAGDELTTGPRAQCTILFLDEVADKNNEVLVDSNSRVRVGSIYDWLGRIIVRVKGAFETKTEKVNLGVKGTEFELVVETSGANRMTVLEGIVTVEKGSFAPSAWSLKLDSSPQRPERLNAQVKSAFAERQPANGEVRAHALRQVDSVEAGKLQQVIVTADDLSMQKATPERVRQTVAWSNEVIIASHQSYTAQSVIPNFRDTQELAIAFRTLRLSTVLRGDTRSYEALGNAYVDWGDGAKALDAYAKTRKMSTESTPEFQTNLGEAYRLAGRLKEAEAAFKFALKLDSTWAPAFNGLGNLYLDEAKVERDKRDFANARMFLEEAKEFYMRASAGTLALRSHHQRAASGGANPTLNKGIIQSSLGEVYRAWGDVAQDQRKESEALAFYQVAEQQFKQAQELAPAYTFTHTGLGSVYRELNKVTAEHGDKVRAADAFKKSEAEFSQAIEQHKDLGAAYVGLGNLYENAGGKTAAIKLYSQGTQRRPEEPTAHYYLAMALAESNPRLAAAHAGAYLSLEPAALRQGEKTRNAQRLAHSPAPTSTATPTPNPSPKPTATPVSDLTIRIPGVKGDKPEDALKKLRAKGLDARIQDQADCEATGRAVSTSPARDEKVGRGTLVTVFISSAGENPAIVPKLRGLSQFEAERAVSAAGLVTERPRTRESDSAPGTVLSQSPADGKQLKRGCSVELTIAIPIPLVVVPRYIGRTRDEALQELQRYFGEVVRGDVIEVDSEQRAGTVLDQDPKPGTRVRRGTRVNLYIARSNQVFVPDVRGRTLEQARKILEGAGLKVGKISQRPSGSSGIVLEQNPQPNTRVRLGSEVSLVVSYIIG